ncbi:MAG: WbqC family protein [Methanosarcinales archaeon]
MTKIAIHQPMYLPYPGFFNKMKNVDIFVFLDDAKYSEGYYYNRNRIKTPKGILMLTVPIKKSSSQKLNQVEIANNIKWQKKHLKSLYANYSKAYHFKDYIEFFEEVYNTEWKTLQELNMKTLFYLIEKLNIDVPIYFSSDLLRDRAPSVKTQRIIDICQELDADVYLSGIGGKNYLDKTLFEKNNIKLEYQNYVPKEYKQLWGTFIPNLSVIDLLFNLGENAKEVI